MKIYAGIGSRATPADVLVLMHQLAERLAQHGVTLRSGAAEGADTAFEQGCDAASGSKEIYLAWRGYNGSSSERYTVTQDALALAKALHPAWERLGRGVQKLHASSCQQVLGGNLQAPVQFVICWTKDGCESRKTRTSATGGTGTTIALADSQGIRVFNLKNADSRHSLGEFLNASGIEVRDLMPAQPVAAYQAALF